MKKSFFFLCLLPGLLSANKDQWTIDSQADWNANTATQTNLQFEDGMAIPIAEAATFQSKLMSFTKKQSAISITVSQSPIWENWVATSNVGPSNLGNAPVALSLGANNYWMFGQYSEPKTKKNSVAKGEFIPEPATLEGFDIPLQSTADPLQFNSPGGLKKGLGGYHAWQSRDMVHWVHHGAVSERFSRWMTTAEFVNGKAYLYYDFPNDQDPHVYVDDDLTDGLPGKNMGMAFKDPSHGSDSAIIRDLEGKFHLILENWDPINAQKNAWDSPLASHAVSPDGLSDFELLQPAVDYRTNPTGEIATFKHPHWVREDPGNYKTSVAEYEIHEPKQDAYGDWASIAIGGQYYLFGDYDPAHGHNMSVGWFTSSSIYEPFKWCGHIGKGHPDPDIMFAEGQFYLVTQQNQDFVSPGPWVESVEVRVGVDSDNDGGIDQWTDWEVVKESYNYIPGFAKQIAKTPAQLDLSNLPAGYSFQFELKIADTTANISKPILDAVRLTFSD